MSKKEKKNADGTLEIIEEIFDDNKRTQRFFPLLSEVDKGKPEPTSEQSIAKRGKLRRGNIAKIKREEKNINNKSFKEYFTIYQIPSHIYKKFRKTEGIKNENQVYLSKKC